MSCDSDRKFLAERKAELRKELRKRRRELSEDEIRSASIKVAEKVKALEKYKKAEMILAYNAAMGELDVSYIIENAIASGKKVAFPLCISDGELKLLIPETPHSFNVGAYGILEPDEGRSHEVLADELDFIIVPAVGFTSDCARLGQGGGYYDRLLSKTFAYTVGVGYDFQLLPELPVELHDRRLDCVILPSKQYIRD